MKIDKAIFGVDDSFFLEFWPLQAKICKQLLGIEPVLFYICEEDSDFYYDNYGLVKKIKKIDNINTGLLACIVRMYGSKYFPDEVCLTCDLDMLMINKKYFVDQIEKYNDDSLVIYSSDAYDLNRDEVIELFQNENFPFLQEMYNYPYNAAKGKTFNKILDTECSFEDFVIRHSTYKPGYKFMWMIDEFYFADCVNNNNHGVEIHKLKRGYTSPWKASRRIDRHNFPVELKHPNEIEAQLRDGIYDVDLLKDGYYIDVNCCRPYAEYKQVIDDLIYTVLNKIKEIDLIHRTDLCDIMDKHKSDKASKPDWVNYGGHNYTRFYSQIFEEFRNKDIDLFELGIGTNNTSILCNMGEYGTPGASLRGWKEYFQNANIYGADIDSSILFQEERIISLFCDQTNPQEIKFMWDKLDKRMDIIIDDGYHNFDANLIFLKNSLSKLKYNGYYIIEDISEYDLHKWISEIPILEKAYSGYEFSLVKLKWTHNDNSLLIIRNKTNMMLDLGIKYGNDKVTYHRYDLIYPHFLSHLQHEEIKMLEIGLGFGFLRPAEWTYSDDTGSGSRNMWKEFFPQSKIYVMDIHHEFEDEIGLVIQGDQSNLQDLEKVSNLSGELDFIIDDGSHHPEHQIKSFDYLFSKNLKRGGLYIIEDIECSYWNPKETVYGYETGYLNIIDYFSKLLHEVNSEFSGTENKHQISQITFAKNCILIKKQTDLEIELNKREYRFNSKL